MLWHMITFYVVMDVGVVTAADSIGPNNHEEETADLVSSLNVSSFLSRFEFIFLRS